MREQINGKVNSIAAQMVWSMSSWLTMCIKCDEFHCVTGTILSLQAIDDVNLNSTRSTWLPAPLRLDAKGREVLGRACHGIVG